MFKNRMVKYSSSMAMIVLLFLSSCKEVKKAKIQKEEVKTFSMEELKNQHDNWKPRTREEMKSLFEIQIFDDEALKIISPDAKPTILASGFSWTEGPVWVEKGDFLLFSDIPNKKVYKLDKQLDTVTYLHPSGISVNDFTGKEAGSNGLLIDNEGSLVLLQHGGRAVGKMKTDVSSPKASYEILVDSYLEKRLNSPNDGAYDAEGNLYFTDPPYGLPLIMDDPTKELNYQGVYCLLKSGELVLLDDQLKFPNGICLSPDGKKLFVAVSNIEKPAYYEYDITTPGNVTNKKVFYDVRPFLEKEGYQGLPDGLKITESGYVLATGPKGLLIFNMKGKLLARVFTGQLTSNCALGKDEEKLYMTAHKFILSLDLR